MASLRQLRANQLNALKSAGPTTPEGKAIARRNGLKHGLAGTGLVLPEDEAEAVNERWAQWHSSLKPDDAYSDWMVERISSLAVRLERCEYHERALLEISAARAGGDWDLECRLAAESLGEGLPKAPGRVALELRRTAAGRAWLLARWEALGAILAAGGAWDAAQRSLALDLLGTPPALRTAPNRADAEAPALRALVEAERDRLDAIEPGGADDLERTAAELGLGPVDRELALARRYGRSLTRQIHEFRKQLKLAMRPYHPVGPDPRWADRPASAEAPPRSRVEDPWRPEPMASRAAEAPPIAAPAARPAPAPAPEPILAAPAADRWASCGPVATHFDPSAPPDAARWDRVPAPMPGSFPAPNRQARRAATAQARRHA